MIIEMGELWIYIGGGCIFWSGVMHANIFLGSKSFSKKNSKLKCTHPLTKINTARVAMWIIFRSGRNVYEEPS
jgi:hypothetical protein